MDKHTLKRLWQHWQSPRLRVQRYFPADALARISREIGLSENQHNAQVRFVIESRFSFEDIWLGVETRTRAWQWFGELGVWDTEQNCGVLVYVSFADRQVEIVADRGISSRVPPQMWQAVVDVMLAGFRQGEFVAGLENGLKQTTDILRQYYPYTAEAGRDSLPDDVVLR